MAEVDTNGRKAWFNALAQPDVTVGDYVLTHANLIVSIIPEEEAERMFDAIREMEERARQEDGGS
jgi:hydrogenase maturation factor